MVDEDVKFLANFPRRLRVSHLLQPGEVIILDSNEAVLFFSFGQPYFPSVPAIFFLI
jgi:hypothetical protein